jgi:DNA-binding beta-propeller fold protein YncE
VDQHTSELEDRIRRALRDPRRELPAWPDPMRRVRRSARRQRARRALVTAAFAGAAALIVLLAAGWLRATAHRPQHVTAGLVCSPAAVWVPRSAPGHGTGAIGTRLVRPGALAVGPRGQVYVADDGLNQILQVLPGGRFKVIAGNGRRGYSGDGGPAIAAALNFPGGMTVTRGGTIYFADTGNNRVRAIWPSGTITTVAGTGQFGTWTAGGSAALHTSLAGPAAVAVSPGGCLYIADEGNSEILRLSRSGRLARVAGTRGAGGVTGIGRLAANASADGPDGLAFDRAGALYIAGRNTKQLLMISAGGRMRLPIGHTGFYPHGMGGLAAGPAGVIAMNGQRVQEITHRGLRTLFDFSRDHPAGIRGFLPNGIAVGPDGAIYLDTDAGNGYSAKTALIEVRPGGQVRVLWQS